MWYIVLLVSLFLVFYVFENFTIEVDRYSVEVQKEISKEIKILHLTDLHGNKFFYKQLIKIIKQENPDVIVMTGDFLNERTGELGVDFLKQLKGISMYYVTGNHELRSSRETKEKLTYKLRELEIKNLDELKMDIFDNQITFIGLTASSSKNKKIPKSLKDLDKGKLNILLMHQPETIEELREYDIDIIFAGHAHGGQWRIPFLKQGIFAPDQGLFPKYTSGMYKEGNTAMFVSRGIGTMTWIPRIFNRPHIIVVTSSTPKRGGILKRSLTV